MVEAFNWPGYRVRVAEFLGVKPEAITRETNIYVELGIDSLGMFSLGMHLIKCFRIKLPLSEVSTIATVGDLFTALERHEHAE